MKHEYIKLIQQPKYSNNISITWEVTSTCTYECSYCPSVLHDGKYRFPEYEYAINFFDKLIDAYPQKRIFLELTGGEPTLWPKFAEFLKECYNRNISIHLISNGSRSPNWWDNNN